MSVTVGATVSISNVLIVHVLVLPPASVDVISTGHVVGIGLGVILKLHDQFTTHVPSKTHVELNIEIVVHTSPVPVSGEKLVGVSIVGGSGESSSSIIVIGAVSSGTLSYVSSLSGSSTLIVSAVESSLSMRSSTAVTVTL